MTSERNIVLFTSAQSTKIRVKKQNFTKNDDNTLTNLMLIKSIIYVILIACDDGSIQIQSRKSEHYRSN